jgi:ApbE superfamily uncharacterized protein (UPF0280 family)
MRRVNVIKVKSSSEIVVKNGGDTLVSSSTDTIIFGGEHEYKSNRDWFKNSDGVMI